MSVARFDTGQDLVWEPLGTFHAGQSVGAAPLAIANINPTAQFFFRVDYASLVLRFLNLTDVNAWAEMSLSTTTGVYPAFLTVSSSAETAPNPLEYQERYLAQLTLPFVVIHDAAIFIRGGSDGTAVSNYDGTVTLSRAPILP
jgi:hypothetical protein